MSELKIPDGLLDKIYQAVDEQIGWTAHAEHAISIAAPLIVAAELRRIVNELATIPQHSANCTTTSDFIHHIRTYAYLLDPQGVTK